MMLGLQGQRTPEDCLSCVAPPDSGLFAAASALGLAAPGSGAPCTLVDAARWKAYLEGAAMRCCC